jgi:hypothetical protein
MIVHEKVHNSTEGGVIHCYESVRMNFSTYLVSLLPGSPQKKMIQPIIEEESNAQEGEVESNNSAER